MNTNQGGCNDELKETKRVISLKEKELENLQGQVGSLKNSIQKYSMEKEELKD